MARALSAIALLVALVLAPEALAARPTCLAPPGTAAVEQYCENLPAAGGPRPPMVRRAPPPSHGPHGRLSNVGHGRPSNVESARTALGAVRPPHASKRAGGAPPARQELSVPSGSVIKATGSAIGQGEVAGGSFPWILVLAGIALALAVAAVGIRRRTRGSQPRD